MLTELLLSAAAPARLWWAPQGLMTGGSEVWHGHGQGGWVWPQLLSSLVLHWVSPVPSACLSALRPPPLVPSLPALAAWRDSPSFLPLVLKVSFL